MSRIVSFAMGIVLMLFIAGCGTAGVTQPPSRDVRPVTVGVRALPSIALTAPINGSNLDYSGVGENFAASGVITALRDYQGGTIRYPGGAIANYWDWQNGSVNQPATISSTGKLKPARIRDYGFTLQTLQGIVRESGVSPVFDLNLLTSTLSDQLLMLHTAQNLGIPVRYVELGNEFYLANSSYLDVFPTAVSYARTVAQWALAIRAAFPGAQIAAVGALPQNTARERSWNSTLISVAGADINAVTLHDYTPIGKDTLPAQVLATAQTSWGSVQKVLATIPGQYRIWFTEFNLSLQGIVGGEPPRGITWLHGLYVAEMMSLFDQSPRVQLDDYWDLFSSPSTGAFTVGDLPQPTDAGVALMFLTNASAQAYRVTPLSFTGTPTMPDGAAGVLGVSFYGPNGTRTVLINLTDQSVTMSAGTDTGLPTGAHAVTISAAPTMTVSGLIRSSSVLGTTITLPGYAISGVGFTVPLATNA
ncbi:MAG: hypothetical protein ACP5OR_04225 [Candidatus Dormibacteria bacterium]